MRKAAGRVKVIGGTGSNNTNEALRLTAFAKKVGCDAALMVNPYNKPNQRACTSTLRKCATKSACPSCCTISRGALASRWRPRPSRGCTTTFRQNRRHQGSDGLSRHRHGNRQLVRHHDSFGRRLADAAPHIHRRQRHHRRRLQLRPPARKRYRRQRARERLRESSRSTKMFKLIKLMFCEPNPQPCKAAMAMLGMCTATCRLPCATLRPRRRQDSRDASSLDSRSSK